MSFNVSMGTITVDDVTYDVKEHGTDSATSYTIQFDGEDVFEGLEGAVRSSSSTRSTSTLARTATSARWLSATGVTTSVVTTRGHQRDRIRDPCPTCDGSGESQHWMVGFHRRPQRWSPAPRRSARRGSTSA